MNVLLPIIERDPLSTLLPSKERIGEVVSNQLDLILEEEIMVEPVLAEST